MATSGSDPHDVFEARSTERDNFYTLCTLLIDGGTRVLRDVLDLFLPPAELERELSDQRVRNTLPKSARLTKEQCKILYPTPATCGKSSDFDITMLFQILIFLVFRDDHLENGWNELPPKEDHRPVADLVRIKFYRNKLYAHSKKTKVCDEDFERYWNDVSEALVRLEKMINFTNGEEWENIISDYLESSSVKDCRRDVRELHQWCANDMESEVIPEASAQYANRNEVEMFLSTEHPVNQRTESEEMQRFPSVSAHVGETTHRATRHELVKDSMDSIATVDRSISTVSNLSIESETTVNRSISAMEDDGPNVPPDPPENSPVEEATARILLNYLDTTPPRNRQECEEFEAYLLRVRNIINAGSQRDTVPKREGLVTSTITRAGDEKHLSQEHPITRRTESEEVQRFVSASTQGDDTERGNRKGDDAMVTRTGSEMIGTSSFPLTMERFVSDPRDVFEARSTERDNFYTLCTLLIDGGTRVLRDVLDHFLPPAELERELRDQLVRKTLPKSARLTKKQSEILYPTPATCGKSSDFDITMLFQILRFAVFQDQKLDNGWNELPPDEDHRPVADLVRIKFYRNKLYAQVTETKVCDEDFERYWNDVCKALVRLEKMINSTNGEEWKKVIYSYLEGSLETDYRRDVQELHRWCAYDMESEVMPETSVQYAGRNEVPPEILARGALAIEAYNKALVDGRTRAKRVPVMLIGQDRSGKTSIKKSLMGKPFDSQEGSTVGIEVDHSYFKVTNEIWKTKQDDEGANTDPAISYEHHVARLTSGSLKKQGTTLKNGSVALLTIPMDDPVPSLQGHKLDVGSSNESSVGLQGQESDVELSKESSVRQNHSEATKTARELEDSESNLDLQADAVRHSSSQGDLPVEVPEDVATLITKFLKDGDSVEDEEEVYSVLWDFGGQSVYYVTHPLFLTPGAIYLLIYDLSRNLHDLAIPIGRQGVYKKVHDVYCGKTNIDYLDVWMTSVASLASQDETNPKRPKSEKLPKRLPPVFLVCTHADKPYGNSDSITQAVEVLGSLQTKPYSNHLFENVFAVDNTKSGSGEKCPEVVRLRKEVHAAATELLQMKEDIPVKWLKYEKHIMAISKQGHKWISLTEARQVAFEVCKIVSDDEFSTLLNFLHDQRILMHFSDTPKLNKMVILDLQWLIDVFKKVITVKRFDPKEKEFTDQWRKLEKTGILEGKLLEHVWGPLFNQQETAEGLLAIMEKFSLLCPWPFSKGSEEYLVPSMLMSHPPDGVLKLLASARVASLFVKFDSGQVPQGLFPRLVLQLFQWCTEEWSSQSQPQLFHNFARFYPRPGEERSVILLCHSTSIEIVVHSGSCAGYYSDDHAENLQSKVTLNEEFKHDPQDVILCRDVGRQLGLVLNCMREELCWLKHMKCEMCVCCTVCCNSGSVKYCYNHREHNCKQEECLHLIPESELRKRRQPIFCRGYAAATENRVQVQQFAPWFPFLDEQQQQETGDERDERHFLATAGHDEQFALALPSAVLEALLSETSDAKDVVVQLQESLQLDRASLEQPKPETKQLIRCLASKAKCAKRLDVVKHLRTITPAGTTGPLLPENHHVQDIPCRQRKDLTINLCGGDEWKEVAESLGLTPAEIRYLDNRTINPCDAALAHSGNQRYISVGNLYDVLVDCKLPQYADFL